MLVASANIDTKKPTPSLHIIFLLVFPLLHYHKVPYFKKGSIPKLKTLS